MVITITRLEGSVSRFRFSVLCAAITVAYLLQGPRGL